MNIVRIAELLKAKPVRPKARMKEGKVLAILDGFNENATDKQIERVLTSTDSRALLWNLVEYEELKKKPPTEKEKKFLADMQLKVLAMIEAK